MREATRSFAALRTISRRTGLDRRGLARGWALRSLLPLLAAASSLAVSTALAPAALAAQNAAEPTSFVGLPLSEALRDLQSSGLRIVFSTELVRPEMIVEREPVASEPRRVLEEILAPHGLAVREGPRSRLVVVAAQPSAEEGAAAAATGSAIERARLTAVVEEEMVVTPSRLSLLRDDPLAPLALDRDDILELPHLGDDFFRALSLLPGITANDVSAEFHVRGGRRDETLIVLDGQELYDSYHLKDYDNALSVVAPTTLDVVDLSTGGFAADHGDRMAGVLDMVTVTPGGPTRTRVGVSVVGAHAGASGGFDGDRGGWMGEIRRGSADLVGDLIGNEAPNYWDGFAKVRYGLGPKQEIRFQLLHSDDELEIFETTVDGTKEIETNYESGYQWLTHTALPRSDLLLESALSRSRIERDRRGLELEEDVQFSIVDLRDLEVLAVRQGWSLQASPQHSLRWGFELRDFEALYDYTGFRTFDNPLAAIRHDAEDEETLFAARFDERHDSVYLVDRFRLAGSWTLELGLRYDRHTQTEQELASPRLNVAWAVGRRSVLRAAWGRFNQSQRPYELQVEDGETIFHPVERSEHRVLGFEHLFDLGGERSDLAFRIEMYRRLVENPLPRYENLYEPINNFPEVEPDRVRVAPDESVAEGVEVFVRGAFGKVQWWFDYARSSTEDTIDGERFPRRFDQPDAFNLDVGFPLGGRWTLNLAWRYHTGWPTTPLSLEAVEVEPEDEDDEPAVVFVPVLGRRASARLAAYHRLDLRASRRWNWKSTAVTFFVDVQNVYDRANAAGFDFEIDQDEGVLIPNAEFWTGILPSIGVVFQF